MTGSSPLAFFSGTRWNRCAVALLWTVRSRLEYCDTRPPDAANGLVVSIIEPVFCQDLGSVLDIE